MTTKVSPAAAAGTAIPMDAPTTATTDDAVLVNDTATVNDIAKTPTAQEALAHFGRMIASYEHRIGHACRAVASELPRLVLKFLDRHRRSHQRQESGLVGDGNDNAAISASLLPNPLHMLDNACGTGAVSETFLQAFSTTNIDIKISAVDITPDMVDAFRSLLSSQSSSPSSPLISAHIRQLHVEDSQTLTSYADDTFDLSVTNFGIFFFPDPIAGARQIYRTLKLNGIAVVTVWKSLGFEPLLWEVQRRIQPLDPLHELVLNAPWYRPEKLAETLEAAGFGGGDDTNIEFDVVKTNIWGRDRDDLLIVLVQNMSAMVSRNWSDEEKARLSPVAAEVLDEMYNHFCVRDDRDGRCGCPMEAWVAICSK